MAAGRGQVPRSSSSLAVPRCGVLATSCGAGGLHLETAMTIDHIGRTTKVTDPVGSTSLGSSDIGSSDLASAAWSSASRRATSC
jgi:hypothetical protein